MRPVLREGSREHAAFVAYQAARALGYTGLKLLLIQAVARHGGHCWRKNSDLAKQFGTRWHTSVWRVAQQLKGDRILRLQRVLPGQRPDGVQTRYTEGRSSKFLDWKRLGCPEAVEDWRRPDTATRDPGKLRPRGTPKKRRLPDRAVPPPEPPPLSVKEQAELADEAYRKLYGRPPPR